MVPADLRYTESHEWARLEGDLVTVGITRFAVDQLTDVTAIELPKVGKAVVAGKDFGFIETVKAVSDLYAPVSGVVAEVNTAIPPDGLGPIADDPFGAGWLVKIRVPAGTTLDAMKTPEQYEDQIAGGAH